MDKEKMISIGVFALILLVALFAILGMAKNKENNEKKDNQEKEVSGVYSEGKHHAIITIKDYGVIKLELDADIAPITVANFAKLVNEGFYEGLTFHRIMEGFMMQGGAPKDGKSADTIKGEFSANGVNNSISHVRGTISMARTSVMDSASSQFFIVHKDSTFLDGQYAGFGHVTEGIEVVDKVCESVEAIDDNGTIPEKDQPIIEKIEMVD